MDVSEKPIGLILLDLIFWIIPEIEIFGETVRDLLSCEEFSVLNLQIMNISAKIFSKKLKKFRDNIEIHGYILKVDSAEHYHQSWYLFEDNFVRHGMTAGIIQKIGSNQEQIRVLLITPDKLVKYHPIYLCNMLKMTSEGHLSILDPTKLLGSGYLDQYRLATVRVALLQDILGDIYGRKINPIVRPIKISSGYEDRFRRSEMILMLVELMEKGWTPTFNIDECGFDLEIYRIENLDMKFEYPKIRKVYRKLMNESTNITNIITNLDDKDNKSTDDKSSVDDSKLSDICAICHENMLTGSILRMGCTHMFHNYCIYQHFHKIGANSDLCPVCRTMIVKEMPRLLNNNNDDYDDTTESDESSSDSTNVDIPLYQVVAANPPPPPPQQANTPNRNNTVNNNVNNVNNEDSSEESTVGVELEQIVFDYETEVLNSMVSADADDD